MPRRLSEELSRKEMIDPQLEKAGWYLRDHSTVKIKIPRIALRKLGRQPAAYLLVVEQLQPASGDASQVAPALWADVNAKDSR